MEIDFVQPARIDDIMTVETKVERLSGARIFMAQTIQRDETLLIKARVEAAIISASGKPRRFPKQWAAAFLGEAG
jgi:acyl-CoA thioester hydrolase